MIPPQHILFVLLFAGSIAHGQDALEYSYRSRRNSVTILNSNTYFFQGKLAPWRWVITGVEASRQLSNPRHSIVAQVLTHYSHYPTDHIAGRVPFGFVWLRSVALFNAGYAHSTMLNPKLRFDAIVCLTFRYGYESFVVNDFGYEWLLSSHSLRDPGITTGAKLTFMPWRGLLFTPHAYVSGFPYLYDKGYEIAPDVVGARGSRFMVTFGTAIGFSFGKRNTTEFELE